MSTAFIFHGAFGYPEENWFPWLKEELEKRGYAVYIPKFPTPENQTLENWKSVFSKYEKFLDGNSILIGHSLGVPFLFRVLEQINFSVRATLCVAGLITRGDPKFHTESFVDPPFTWEKIRKNSEHFQIFHSDNDPYLPLTKAEEISQKLNTKITLLQGAGHFNEAAGYTTFEKLLSEILKIR